MIMKKAVIIAAILSFSLGACTIQTCPTYSKQDQKPSEKVQEPSERV